ncbi:hypothetical protein PJ985_17280 [Streptomyces sp. ACA25]|uniref:hypothetical protein n=1 Tax=Streptomyces sp. ACA25 TaxID=3022596 RepID=UPI002306E5F2|nr:hypothetical protein [Streptomyces sp. ACA25]MDB1089318.1 hypothetical protein [Streptomyces sp. ACA25]
MSTLRTTLATLGLSVTVLGGSAPASLALDTPLPDASPGRPDSTTLGYSVSPHTVRAGGSVDLTVTGCTDHGATARSGAFAATALGEPGPLQSTRVGISGDTRPGAQYDVVLTCGERTGTAQLVIAEGSVLPESSGPAPEEPAPAAPGAPQAGAAGQRTGDPSTVVTGAGISVAALLGMYLLHRRRSPGVPS